MNVFVTPFVVTLILAFPGFNPVTRPFESTFAIFFLFDLNVTDSVGTVIDGTITASPTLMFTDFVDNSKSVGSNIDGFVISSLVPFSSGEPYPKYSTFVKSEKSVSSSVLKPEVNFKLSI